MAKPGRPRKKTKAGCRGPDGFTDKQRAFLIHWFETGNVQESALKVYKCANGDAAQRLGQKILALPKVRQMREEAIKPALEMMGASMLKMAKVVAEAMEANIVKITRGKNEDGSMKTLEVPDWDVRLRAVDLAAKLRGLGHKDKGKGTKEDEYDKLREEAKKWRKQGRRPAAVSE